MNHQELFKNYYTTLHKDITSGYDYDKVSKGYEAIYYDALPQDKNAKILDLGCGAGFCLYYLKKKGYKNIIGIDISREMVEVAKEREEIGEIILVEDSIKYLKEHKSEFDCIIMNYLIEHIPKEELINMLISIYNTLKKEGTLLVQTPSINGLTAMHSRYNDFTHTIIFVESTLKQVLLMAGFKEVRFIKQRMRRSYNPKTIVFRFLRLLYIQILKFIYLMERPGEADNPNFFLQSLVAQAKK